MKIHPKYYEDGTPENAMLWKQLSEIDKKSKKGTNINVKYVEELEGETKLTTTLRSKFEIALCLLNISQSNARPKTIYTPSRVPCSPSTFPFHDYPQIQ
jgi:hypothetical protein